MSACLVVDPTRAVIGHGGDNRAYLLSDGHLTALTRDHTAAPHMLTRNLGREYGVLPDMLELALKPGGPKPVRFSAKRDSRGVPEPPQRELFALRRRDLRPAT